MTTIPNGLYFTMPSKRIARLRLEPRLDLDPTAAVSLIWPCSYMRTGPMCPDLRPLAYLKRSTWLRHSGVHVMCSDRLHSHTDRIVEPNGTASEYTCLEAHARS